MELEFDKEIDAILRKARIGISVTNTSADHLDADTIAAFAENALPDKAKLLYIEHFAHCESCRKQLSFVMQMNKEPVEAAVAAPAVEPVIEASIPWYQTFFRARHLALAMGGLVLVFSGVLGYLVIQKQNASDSATVSQMKESEQSRGGPSLNNDAASNTAPLEALIATANPTPPSADTAANSAAAAPGETSGLLSRADSDTSKSGAAPEKNFQIDGASGSENNFVIDGQEAGRVQPQPKSAAEPDGKSQPDAIDSGISSQSAELLPKGINMSGVLDATTGAAKERDEKKANSEQRKDDLAKRKLEERGRNRDAPHPASKVGPSRGVGPVQNQSNQIYNKNYDMPVTRIVGGKTFNNRDGAWYDSAYRGQATANYRRSSVEYKKLDSGLRNIADKVGGTVVLVWKSKAYRIQ